MNTVAENPNPALSSSTLGKVAWFILIAATLGICYFSHLGAIGFVGPDEPRYAWIARDMVETGDWVTPRLYGKPWFEKPPLYYWGAALSFQWFGVTELAARLPSAVSALLVTLALAWLAFRWYGLETARWFLLFLPTTVGMMGFSHAAATDMPFAAMLGMAMVCSAAIAGLTRNEHTPVLPRTPWLALLLFGFFLGLAVLAKGPAAIILSGGAIFSWALLTKRWRDALRLLHPVALASFSATALPWYVLCARRNPDFLQVFFLEHNFKRYLTPEFGHVQPLWFYLPVLLVAFLPWTALLLWSSLTGAIELWRSRRIGDSAVFLICWAGFCIVFFSLSRSKLPGYALPSFPALGLLMSHLCLSRHRSFLRAPWLMGGLFFFFLWAVDKPFLGELSRGNEKWIFLAGVVLGLLGLANLFLGVFLPGKGSGRLAFLPALAVLPVLLAFWVTDKLVIPYFRWDPSGRTIARELRLRKVPASQLSVAQMSRGMQYSLSFYLHEEIKPWDRDHPREGYLLTGGRRSCREWSSDLLACEELPFNLEATGRFLYLVTLPNSAISPTDRGQVQQKK